MYYTLFIFRCTVYIRCALSTGKYGTSCKAVILLISSLLKCKDELVELKLVDV
jgi:hypothetical protein